jgi:hypothetical protein
MAMPVCGMMRETAIGSSETEDLSADCSSTTTGILRGRTRDSGTES